MAAAIYNNLTTTGGALSAGLNVYVGAPVSVEAAESMKRIGIDISQNTCQLASAAMASSAEYLVFFEQFDQLPDFLQEYTENSECWLLDVTDIDATRDDIRHRVENLIERQRSGQLTEDMVR